MQHQLDEGYCNQDQQSFLNATCVRAQLTSEFFTYLHAQQVPRVFIQEINPSQQYSAVQQYEERVNLSHVSTTCYALWWTYRQLQHSIRFQIAVRVVEVNRAAHKHTFSLVFLQYLHDLAVEDVRVPDTVRSHLFRLNMD